MKRKPGTVYYEAEERAPSPSKAATLSAGDVVGGHYVIEELIDEGGMAVVYRATNSATGRACALKVLHAQLGDRAEFVHLFAKEAKVSSVIGDSAHIVQVYDAGLDADRGIPFIVMELLEGETLERVLERGPLAPRLARTLLEQLATALDHAHEVGVVHRDLKPSNLFVTTDRHGQPRLKVMDFGIAKVLEGEALRTATHIGTPAYNAPEQMGSTTRKLAAKQGITIAPGVSPATDVWALGLIVYEMLTGEIPGRYWGVETLSELPMKVAFEELAPASQRAGRNAPLLPAGFDAWFSRCLAKNAEERFPTAGEAIGQLLQLLADDVHEVTDEDLEGVSTRLHSSPVPTADQARTRVKSVQSAKGSIKTPSSNTSEPPPLPRISSPAITVTPRADDSDQHAAVTTPPPVVRSETTTTRRNDPGGSRWGLAFAGLALVAGVAGAVAYERSQKATAAATCIQDGNTAECESACQSGNVASCAELGFQIAATDAEHARGLLEKACGVAPVADTAALRAWTVKVESAGCVEGQCVAAACVELAAMHEQGRGGALQSARAASSLYKRTCRVGLDDKPRGSEGCVGLGAERERAGEIEAARQFYAAACEDGISEGCVDLAHILERGNGEWRDEKRARELYQKACDGGDLKGCTRLGSMVERGRGGWVKDEKAAVDLYRKACDGGQQLGCVHLAAAHAVGRGGVTKDSVRAAELLSAACEAGELSACPGLAEMVMGAQGGLSRDEKRAFELNKRACEGGAMAGCANLATMYAEGQAGLTKNDSEAQALADRACRGGDARGCLVQAKLLKDKSPAELTEVMERACEGGELSACSEVAEGIEQQESPDLHRAVTLYTQACDGGVLRACTNLANLQYQGQGGLERDAKRSVALNEKACDGGDLVGCTRLGLLYALGHGVDKDLTRAKELHVKACAEAPSDPGDAKRCEMLGSMTAEDDEKDE